jgi:hypothetical protein
MMERSNEFADKRLLSKLLLVRSAVRTRGRLFPDFMPTLCAKELHSRLESSFALIIGNAMAALQTNHSYTIFFAL